MHKIICRVIQNETGNSVFQNTANGCLPWEQHRLLKNSVLLGTVHSEGLSFSVTFQFSLNVLTEFAEFSNFYFYEVILNQQPLVQESKMLPQS